MKTLILLSTLAASFSTFAYEPLLSNKEADLVLKTIDNLCGDTWCEGSYNYQFDAFNCDKTTTICTLQFQFIKENEGKKTFSSTQKCAVKGVTTFRQVMKNNSALNDQFYSAIDNCISQKEANIRF